MRLKVNNQTRLMSAEGRVTVIDYSVGSSDVDVYTIMGIESKKLIIAAWVGIKTVLISY